MKPIPALEIRISDNGIGIPESDCELVFENFYPGSLGEVLKTPGTGFGLPICRAIIEAHGGRIWVEKSSQQGTTIAFTLPLSTG